MRVPYKVRLAKQDGMFVDSVSGLTLVGNQVVEVKVETDQIRAWVQAGGLVVVEEKEAPKSGKGKQKETPVAKPETAPATPDTAANTPNVTEPSTDAENANQQQSDSTGDESLDDILSGTDAPPAQKPDEKCACGSGKKYKNCHGKQ